MFTSSTSANIPLNAKNTCFKTHLSADLPTSSSCWPFAPQNDGYLDFDVSLYFQSFLWCSVIASIITADHP